MLPNVGLLEVGKELERPPPSLRVPDGRGRTPLQLAVRGCVDSYWTEYRSPESVKALLEAGA